MEKWYSAIRGDDVKYITFFNKHKNFEVGVKYAIKHTTEDYYCVGKEMIPRNKEGKEYVTNSIIGG